MRAVADPLDGLGGDAAGLRPLGGVLTLPIFERHGDDFSFRWDGHAVAITINRVRENSDGLHAEAWVTIDGADAHFGRLNLVSTPSRAQLVKALEGIRATDDDDEPIQWRAMLERVCRETTRALRTASPAVLLRPRPAVGPVLLIEPIIPFGETMTIFADGGSGKGWLALTLALTALNGLTLPGGLRFTGPRRVPTLYLDWESTQTEIEERVYLLSRGLKCSADGLHYKRMARALADDGPALRAEVSRLGVGLVIVDSLAPACGPEPDGADAVIRTLNECRTFGPAVSRLVLAHVSKTTAEQRGTGAKPYGSVFTWNLSRAVWELRRSEDEGDDLVVGVYHRKANRGRLHAPIGLRFAFDADSVTLKSADLGQSADLLARASVPQRVRAVLVTGAKSTAEIAEALDIAEDTVSRTLRRMADKGGAVKLPAGEDRRVRWGLPA